PRARKQPAAASPWRPYREVSLSLHALTEYPWVLYSQYRSVLQMAARRVLQMSEDFHTRRAGLDLPADVLPPFLLPVPREDLHIMAFFNRHSDYEAVEAMIRYRGNGTPSIRAILTRHDQRQIDHVNDDHLFAEGGGVLRQTCCRDIEFVVDALPGRRHAR